MVTTALVTATLAGAAHAQDSTPRTTENPNQGLAAGNVIEEIVVTAEKREQSLQDVPVAVSAFTDETREVVGIRSVQDLTNFTPGLAYATNTDRINMRGIGRFTNNRSSEGGVAMYSDGFFTSSVTSFARSTLFIERTEVLRGPQGTLYGRNAIGGALNIISKRPTDEFYAEVRANFENYDLQTYEAAVSGPLWGNIRGRLAGTYTSQDEGYFTNISDGRTEGGRGDTWQIEYQLDGELADGKFEWWFKGSTAEWDTLGRGPGGRTTAVIGQREIGQLLIGAAPSLTPNPSFGYTTPYAANSGDLRLFDTNTPNVITLEDVDFTLHATLHLDGFDIRYIGGHHYYDYRLQSDLDNSSNVGPIQITSATPFFRTPTNPTGAPGFAIPPGGIAFFPSQVNQYHEEVWWFSNELNFASTTDSPLQWLFGLYQYREGSNYTLSDARFPDQPQFANPINFNIAAPTAFVPAAPNPLRRYAYGSSQNVNESYAAYGQVDWEMTEQWKLTAGLRYTYDRKRAFESARLFCWLSTSPGCPTRAFLTPVDVTSIVVGQGPQIDPAVVVAPYTDPTTGYRHRLLEQDWDAFSGTLGVQWEPDPDTMAYAKYTRGYKAGGFNAGTVTLQQLVSTDKELIDAYEIGLKKNFGGNLQVNASAFYYEYSDIQAPLSGINPITQNATTEFFNLPQATSKGFELETIWQPIDNLQLLLNYSYLDATIEEACCFSDPDDPNATQPGAQPATPTGAQNLSGQKLPSSTPHRVTVNANYTWELAPGDLTASVSYVWRDDTYYSVFNRWYNQAKAYETVDARVLFNDADDRFTVIGFVKNIFDVEGAAGADANRRNTAMLPTFGFITRNLSLIAPRTYGVELQYRFR
ncbi:TonB-dependent receptor [Phenylobacterium terrae]|uniref:TonB-dependent receptor n=1 Tax=Phenylobacterium terrae TaxID=2665495 RepID=A0ABW4N0P9_9CAUL